jgi:hypothetical protein
MWKARRGAVAVGEDMVAEAEDPTEAAERMAVEVDEAPQLSLDP